MAAILARALNGSGPSLLRGRLRSSTAGLRRTLATPETLQLAGARLPPSVFGGDLLSSLGDHLGAALTPAGAATQEGRHHSEPWLRGERARRTRGDSTPARRESRRRLRERVDTLSTHVGVPDPPFRGPDPTHPRSPEARPIAVASPTAPQLATLARQVQEYASRRLSTQSATPAEAGTAPRAVDSANAVTGGPPRREALPAEAGDMLQRFAGIAVAQRADSPASAWRPGPDAHSGSAPRHSMLDAAADTGRARWDLSDRMAEVLCAQAREHGIDLT